MKPYVSLLLFFLFSLFSSLSVVSAETIRNLSVTAIIPPKATDYQFAFNSGTGHQVAQQQTITYEIPYGANSSAGVTTTNTIHVDFSDDKASDNTHVVDYVIGSASTAYNGVQPVVDLHNRTITWTIPNMPAGVTDQKLTFKLATNTNYTEKKTVNVTVTAKMTNNFVTMPLQVVTHEYLFDAMRITPEPTQPAPTTLLLSPSPTPLPAPLGIQSISFNTITDTQVGITIRTTTPTKKILRYGTAPNALTQIVQTETFARNSLIELKNLKPNTLYFFRVTALDATSKTTVSEPFTFTTSRAPIETELLNNSVVITSGDAVVLSDILNGKNVPFGILNAITNFTLTYTFNNTTPLSNLEVITRDNTGNEIQTVTMNENISRVYTAHLRTGSVGLYDVFVRFTDQNGNVIEQKAARLKVMRQMLVLEKDSTHPVGDARVAIKFYNPNTGAYELVARERFGSRTNPAYTTINGELPILLPPGKYQAEISALGYDGQTVAFTLGEGAGQDYPIVYLQQNLTNLTALFQVFQDWQTDTVAFVQTSLLEMFASIRFFNSVAFATLLSFINIGFLMFGLRSGVSIQELAPFFLFHILAVTKKHKGAYLYGQILDRQNNPVSQAVIEVMDPKTHVVLAHTVSTKSGTFALKNTFKQQLVTLLVGKEGYPEVERVVETNTEDSLTIQLDLHQQTQATLKHGIQHTVGEFFELTLLLCLIAELVFIATFGIAKTLPFIILSIFNLSLWIFFQREKRLH